jgi:hypothetical protein
VRSSQRKRTKVEAFGRLKFSQVWEERAQEAQEEQHQPSDWQKNRSGPLVLSVQEKLRRSLQKEETDSRRISLGNPESRWIWEELRTV